ncbi:MAG: hypothetical protein AAGN82_26115 [Myxococcota bacterium]
MRWRRLFWVLTLGGLAGGHSFACSLVEDLEATQCEVDADCGAIRQSETDPATYACREGLCRPVVEPDPVCTSNTDCIGRLDDDGLVISAPYCAIDASASCSGDRATCTRRCRSLTDGSACSVVGYGNPITDDPLVLGAFLPVAGPYRPASARRFPAEEVVEKAVEALNGSGVGASSGPPKSVAVVMCPLSDGQLVEEQALRLVENFDARALITAQNAFEIVELQAALTSNSAVQVPVVALHTSHPATHSADPAGRLFHMVANEETRRSTYRELFSLALERVVADNAGTLPSPLRLVGLLRQDDRDAQETIVELERWLAQDSRFGVSVRFVVENSPLEWARNASDDPLPQVVVSLLGGPGTPVLTEWCNGRGCDQREDEVPIWLFDHAMRASDFWDATRAPAALRGRVVGVEHPTNFSLYRDLELQLIDGAFGYEFLHDAIVALGLAAYRVNQDPSVALDGASLTSALLAVGNGTEEVAIVDDGTYTVRRDQFADARSFFSGTSGPLRWVEEQAREPLMEEGQASDLRSSAWCPVSFDSGEELRVQVGVAIDDVSETCLPDPT